MRVVVLAICIGLLVAAICVAVSAFASFRANGKPVTIYNGGHWIVSCDTIDEERRIAYNCAFSGAGSVSEYHLGINDSWTR